MRVVCESCQAKYQVSDERVAGKKLKIRCRRCAGTIVIRGDLHAAAESEAPQPVIAPAAGVEEWFASIDGEEHGPLSREQLLAWLSEHPAAWDAFLWREGFADWQPAREVEAITAELSPPAPISAPPAPTSEGFDGESTTVAVDVAVSGFGATEEDDSPTRSVAADSLISDAGAPAAEAVPAPVGRAEVSLPPGALSSASAAYDSMAVASSGGASEEPMTGARNENSVLFSAANLAQVAQGSSYATTAPAVQSVPAKSGYASGDASGLIDIRALASLASASVNSAGTAAPVADAAAAPEAARDDLLRQTSGAFTPDTLAPVAMPKSERSSNALPIAIVTGATIVAAAVVFVAFVRPGPGPEPAPAAAAAGVATPEPEPATTEVAAAPAPQAEEEAEPAEAAGEGPDAEETGAEPNAEGREPAATPEQASAKKARRMAALRARKARKSGAPAAKRDKAPAAAAKVAKKDEGGDSLDDLLAPRKAAPAKAEASAPAKQDDQPSVDDLLAGTADKKPAPRKDRSVDDLLDMAVTGKKKAEPKAEAAPDLQPQPTRNDVLKAMRGVEGKVIKCATDAGEKGVATVQVTVAGSGRVTGAQVAGITGAAGSCIARAVRGASFPRFGKPSFTVKFPFRIK